MAYRLSPKYGRSSGEPTAEWRAKYPKQAQLSWDDGGCYPDACFVVLSEDLGFSVTVFTCCACLTIALILVRRCAPMRVAPPNPARPS
eukprot:6274593-Prymnesium_polylepis.1